MGTAQQPLSLNRYLYAQANPTTLIDPTGHCAGMAYDGQYCVVTNPNYEQPAGYDPFDDSGGRTYEEVQRSIESNYERRAWSKRTIVPPLRTVSAGVTSRAAQADARFPHVSEAEMWERRVTTELARPDSYDDGNPILQVLVNETLIPGALNLLAGSGAACLELRFGGGFTRNVHGPAVDRQPQVNFIRPAQSRAPACRPRGGSTGETLPQLHAHEFPGESSSSHRRGRTGCRGPSCPPAGLRSEVRTARYQHP